MNFAIYLPPQSEDKKCPLLYYLSGLTCTEQNFIQKAGAQRFAAEYGFIVVTPDTSPRTYYVNQFSIERVNISKILFTYLQEERIFPAMMTNGMLAPVLVFMLMPRKIHGKNIIECILISLKNYQLLLKKISPFYQKNRV